MKVYFDAEPGRPFIDGYLGAAAAWAKRHGLASDQVLMGEFGALRKDARYFGARAPRSRALRPRRARERGGARLSLGVLVPVRRHGPDGRARAAKLDPAMLDALGLQGR